MTPVLILLAFLLHLGVHAEEIIGGHEVKPHSRPYMAFVKSVEEDGKSSRCGGFLVQDSFVLTAAHCRGSSMTVTLGAHNIMAQEQTQQIIPVAKAIPHPDYNSESKINDIMLLKGDTGGPLVCDNRAHGLYVPQGNEALPNIFTKISFFLPWIKKNMKLP
ncbi:granzyme E-like isoform X3 [Acomys russatus]|uniref:granzyme E-like isoform X3 n=1 Tax=Acomys russatus TaxID=60746 RepID=UPI0021E2688E|nr:granzyme E-like isoform X3 [Acomys russatus]